MAEQPNAYERYLTAQLQDPEFRTEFERDRRTIETIDAIVNALDELAGEHRPTGAAPTR